MAYLFIIFLKTLGAGLQYYWKFTPWIRARQATFYRRRP